MPHTIADIDYILTQPMGFYLRAYYLIEILTKDNADEVMGHLTGEFRKEFISFARECYLPRGGERISIKGSLPEECIEAIRCWLETHTETQ